MRRREIISGFGSAIALWTLPLAARAQQPAGKVYRVGLLFSTTPVSEMAGPDPVSRVARAFVHGLRDLGYVEGKNLVLERRSMEGRFEQTDDVLKELIQRKVDVIVIGGAGELALAAKRVTSTVPIVMATSHNPVEAGIVASLARPGGNITGLASSAGPEIEAKRLQILKEAVPEATRVAFLGTKSDWDGPQGTSVQAAAQVLGMTLGHAQLDPARYGDAFAPIVGDRPHALFASSHPAHFSHRKLIADFALEQRLPSMHTYRDIVEVGGLISYGVSPTDLFRRSAVLVDKILKGAKPADIPVEQPTRFELVINRRTAKALGLAIPPALLVQADEVIE